MPERITTYTEDGLSYQIRVFEEDGVVRAEITVLDGQMDVNAVYYSSADYDGPSTNLGGPLNMNGGGSQFEGERISWENAEPVSSPGLGREGTDKPSFLQAGESMTIDLTGAESLDDVDLIGIRATSTSTPEGSIKGVSRVEEPDDNGDEPEDPGTYDKVFFVTDLDDAENPVSGFAINATEPDPNPFNVPFLPEGSEGSFEDYVTWMEVNAEDALSEIETIIFYDDDLIELFRIDAPEGGFESYDAIRDAYENELTAHMTGLQLLDQPEDGTVDDPDEEEIPVS